MDERNERYHTFPVSILNRIFTDTEWVAKVILCHPVMHDAHNKLTEGGIDHRIKKASEFYRFRQIDIKGAKKRWVEVSQSPGLVTTSISGSLAWDFYYNWESWSTDELVRFTAYCAMKSIIGKRNYANVKLCFLFSRMCGSDSNLIPECKAITTQDERLDHYTKFIPVPEIRQMITRRKIENIKHALMDFHLTIYARNTRGWLVSNKLDQADLVLKAEISKEKNKRDERRHAELEAIKKAQAELQKRKSDPAQSTPHHPPESKAGTAPPSPRESKPGRSD